MPYPITGFAPDVNPLAVDQGILVDANGIFPTEMGGVAPLPSPENVGSALSEQCLGLFQFRSLDGNDFRLIAGTKTKLNEYAASGWIDRSRAGGYVGTNNYRWRMQAWGNAIIATNYSDPMQVSVGGDFADLSGSAPRAKYITSAQDFVISAYTYDATDGIVGNRVWWCAQGDHTDWTPSLSTQAGWKNLDDTPGPITGLAKLGNDFLVFKERALYHATYVGPPYVWSFRLISSLVGARDQEAIVVSDTGVYFVGPDDFYYFDGASLHKQAGQGVRAWFQSNLSASYAVNILSCLDPTRRLIFLFFPTSGATLPNDCLIYHYPSGKWGRWQVSIEAAVSLIQPNVTYDTAVCRWASRCGVSDGTSGLCNQDGKWPAGLAGVGIALA